MRQKESKPIVKRYLHKWFTDVIDDLKSDHGTDMDPFPGIEMSEHEPLHPISKVSSLYLGIFKKTKASYMTSKYINLGSRLGGSYLSSTSTKNPHSFTSMMPIYATVYHKSRSRAVSGVIRGPQHAKNPTDKINMVAVETVTNEFIESKLWEFLPNCAVIKGEKASFVLRKTAMNKMDSSYYALNLNAIFATCNSLEGKWFSTKHSASINWIA